MGSTNYEPLRRVRVGDMRKLLRHRYGHQLPDDDAGRDDLRDLLILHSLAPRDAVRKMRNEIEIMAPWMDGEAEQMIEQVSMTPRGERKLTAKQLGERQRLTNEEREHLQLWTMLPVDLSKEQLAEQKRTKERNRKRRRRGSISRGAYLAKSKSKLKPWEAEGISRRTWYRRWHKLSRD